MLKTGLRQLSLLVFVILSASLLLGRPVEPAAVAPPEAEVRVAMRPFAGLSLDQFFTRLGEIRPTLRPEAVIDPAELSRRIARLTEVRSRLDVKLLEQWRAKMAPVFRVHECEGRVTLFIFPDEHPFVMTHAGVLITLSTKSVQLAASEAGVAGMVAHEVAHAYFTSPLLAAELDRGRNLEREIELACDGIAVATLIKLGLDPRAYAAALAHQIRAAAQGGSPKAESAAYPPLETRLEMIRRVQENFVRAE